jgi:hypothetical protein
MKAANVARGLRRLTSVTEIQKQRQIVPDSLQQQTARERPSLEAERTSLEGSLKNNAPPRA